MLHKTTRTIKPTYHPPWKLVRVISGHLGWVRSAAVEPGNQWFATGAGDRVIKIWDLASGELKLSLTGHISTVRGLAVSPRHPYLFSCGEDKVFLFTCGLISHRSYGSCLDGEMLGLGGK
jgi:pleiotropic regulator 1